MRRRVAKRHPRGGLKSPAVVIRRERSVSNAYAYASGDGAGKFDGVRRLSRVMVSPVRQLITTGEVSTELCLSCVVVTSAPTPKPKPKQMHRFVDVEDASG